MFALRNTFTIASANMSLGGGGPFTANCDAASAPKAAIDNLRSVGIATVIASGNDGFANAVGSPGCISTAMTVGSTNDSDSVSTFSNSGSLVDFFAPGEDIDSSVPGNGFANFDGTSMATPHVAGAWAIARQVSPTASVATVEAALNATGKPVTDTLASPQITRDRIRVFSAAAHLPHGLPHHLDLVGVAGLNIASDGVGLARRTSAVPNPTNRRDQRHVQPDRHPGRRDDPAGVRRLPDRRRPRSDLHVQGGEPDGDARRRLGPVHLLGHAGEQRRRLPDVPLHRAGRPGHRERAYTIGGVGASLSTTSGRPDGQGASLVVVYQPGSRHRHGQRLSALGQHDGAAGVRWR